MYGNLSKDPLISTCAFSRCFLEELLIDNAKTTSTINTILKITNHWISKIKDAKMKKRKKEMNQKKRKKANSKKRKMKKKMNYDMSMTTIA